MIGIIIFVSFIGLMVVCDTVERIMIAKYKQNVISNSVVYVCSDNIKIKESGTDRQ